MSNPEFDCIDRISDAATAEEVVSEFDGFIRYYGYESFLITGLPHPSTKGNIIDHTVLNGWPAEWYERYTTQNHLPNDPVVAHVFKTSTPFIWSEVVVPEDRPEAHEIMDEAASIGLTEGFVVPVFTLSGFQACVTMAGRSPCVQKHSRYMIHLAAIFAYGRARPLLLERSSTKRTHELSPREREVLSWIALGKSGWEIGGILSISEHTVREYVYRARLKLNCTTQAQAVAEAVRRGEIVL